MFFSSALRSMLHLPVAFCTAIHKHECELNIEGEGGEGANVIVCYNICDRDCKSNIRNVPYLSNSDPESNTPTKVNFNYFDIHKFHSSPEINNSCSNKAFSLLNCNIRNIQANFDNLVQLLCKWFELSFQHYKSVGDMP